MICKCQRHPHIESLLTKCPDIYINQDHETEILQTKKTTIIIIVIIIIIIIIIILKRLP